MKYPNSTNLEGALGLSDNSTDEALVNLRPEKKKEDALQSLDLKGQAFLEHNYEQQTGMSNLNGLVVHGGACASLLALGNMAAVGLESSYEILTEKTIPIIPAIPEPGFIGPWPTAVLVTQSSDKNSSPPVDEDKDVLPPASIRDEPTEYYSLQTSMLEHEYTGNNVEIILRDVEPAVEQSIPDVQEIHYKASEKNNEYKFSIQDKAGQALLDSLTHENQPIFIGTSQPDSLIEIINYDGKLIATTSADASGNWRIDLPYTLPNGHYEFSLYSTDYKGERKLEKGIFHLDIVATGEDAEMNDAPLFGLMPIVDSDALFSIMPAVSSDAEYSHLQTFDFKMSELLYLNASELFMEDESNKSIVDIDEFSLQEQIYPEGGITLWTESEGVTLDYSSTRTSSSQDELLTNQLNID